MRWLRLPVLLVTASLVAGCSSQPTRPNVLVLLVDALRADHLGCYGYARPTSPHIDAWARQSTLFVNAYAQSPWTKPSIPTLFTSLYPIQHGVYEGERRGADGRLRSDTLATEFETLAESLGRAGFRTAAFVHNAQLPADHGFSQGFEVYQQGEFDAKEIHRRFLEFVDRGDERPFFAYLHYLDVHWPFQPAAEFRERFSTTRPSAVFDREDWGGLRHRINDGRIQLSETDRRRLVDLHDAGIRELDERIGELRAALEARGLLDRTLIVLTSDHGEELMDHGKVGHGGTLYEEVLRIPLMIHLPGGAEARKVEAPARLLDVYPTVLAAAGVPRPAEVEGRDLFAPANGDPVLIAETRHKRSYRVSARKGRWKSVHHFRAPALRSLVPDRPETFSLEVGMRIKVKGWFEEDGSLVARKLSIKDAGDDDFELSGPLEAMERNSGALRIYGFRVLPTEELNGRAMTLLGELQTGEWVKVEGDPGPDGALMANKLERVPPKERKTEIEGIIYAIDARAGRSAEARVGLARVRVTEDTRIKGAAGPGHVVTARLDPRDDPFTPQRLLSGEGLESEVVLFDLERDPAETRNLAAEAEGVAAELHAELESWLERMVRRRPTPTAARKELDAEQIERLRGLGYVQ